MNPDEDLLQKLSCTAAEVELCMTTKDGISFVVDDCCQPIRMEVMEQPKNKKKATKRQSKTKQKKVHQYYAAVQPVKESLLDGKEKIVEASKVTVKKQRRSGCKNFQGFSMANCVYRDEVHMSCYLPPKYAANQTEDQKMDNYFCTDCKLEPCILVYHGTRVTCEFKRLKEKMEEELGPEAWSELNMGEKMTMTNKRIKEDIMRPIVAEVFSARYAKKRLPGCMLHKVNSEMPSGNRRRSVDIIASIMELEESSDDESDQEFLNRYKIRMEDKLSRHSL
jgi:hypothetical protein